MQRAGGRRNFAQEMRMNVKMKKTVLLGGALLVAAPMLADELDSIPVKKVDLDEITVVGFKQDNRHRVPMAVSNVGQSFLQNNEIRSIKELSGFVPNFYMPDYGSKQGSNIFVRGLGTRLSTATPSVAFYVDGVPHFENSAFDFELMGINNIEILRGPQGTLYGRNATGGIVNLYTASPLEVQRTQLRFGYGSQNDWNIGLNHTSKQTDNFGVSVSANYHQTDGFFRNITTGENADGMKNGALRYGFEWRMTPAWKMKFTTSGDFSSQNGYPYGVYKMDTKEVMPIDYNENSIYDRFIWTNGLNVRYEGTKFSFNSQTSFQYLKDKQVIDQDFTPKPTVAVTNVSNQRLWSQEFTIKSRTTGRYRWLFGAFGFLQDVDKNTNVAYAAPKLSYVNEPDQNTSNLALYHQSTFDITERLTAVAGVRFDSEWAHYRMQKVAENPAKSLLIDRKRTITQLSPKVSLQYAFRDDRMVYASVSKGYKAGGINQAVDKEDAFIYDPEYTWNYEVGAKLNLLNNRLLMDAAVFYVDIKDMQFTQQTLSGNVVNNASQAVSKGAELGLTIYPVKNLSIRANYGFTDAQFQKYESMIIDRKTGKVTGTNNYAKNFIPLVPKHTVGGNVNYTVHNWGFLDKLVVNLGVTAAGPIYFNENNVVKQDFYAVVNGKIAATKGILTWEVWSKNLTDADYLVYAFRTSQDYAQKGRPFSIGTSLIFGF